MEKYVFNPAYLLINDKKRIAVTDSLLAEKDPQAKNQFTSLVHPVWAMFVAMFDGQHSFDDTILKASINLSIDEKTLSTIAKDLIENPNETSINFGETRSSFPTRTLIKMDEADKMFDVSYGHRIRDFFIPHDLVDLQAKRFFKPIEMTFVINLACATDCIYCYANRKERYIPLPTKRILEIIDDAKSLKMKNFTISGGELFLHKDWEVILKRTIESGFAPTISTKVPIDEETIIKFKATGLKKIQISLDSFDPKTLTTHLKTGSDYVNRVTKTLDLLKKHEIEVVIHTILTNYNTSLKNIRQLLSKLNSYPNISAIRFDPVGYSLYVDPVVNQKNMLSAKDCVRISTALEELKIDFPKIRAGSFPTIGDSFRLPEKEFKKRSKCSGNLSQFVLLPDGKVTYCEELYWKEEYIIGDISSQSIEEMWSGSAKDVFDRKQECFQKSSACFSCEDFHNCQGSPGVCWKQIIGSYGTDKWSYPDPRCPKAPDMKFPYFV
jgi:radical SAM protein with 4Fe4S-binding SPASM domain